MKCCLPAELPRSLRAARGTVASRPEHLSPTRTSAQIYRERAGDVRQSAAFRKHSHAETSASADSMASMTACGWSAWISCWLSVTTS